MKIALFSDIHGRTQHIKGVTEDLQNVDLVVICGDITHFGNRVTAKAIIEAFAAHNRSILAVAGNCELPEVEEHLRDDKIHHISGINFACLHGSIITPSNTPNEHYETHYEQILSSMEPQISNSTAPFVLISHQPPYGTINDKLPSGLHVGSRAVRKFIEKVQPLACLTGHIHEGKGCDSIGSTKVINPGAFSDGFYAIIEIPFIPCEVRYQLKQAKI